MNPHTPTIRVRSTLPALAGVLSGAVTVAVCAGCAALTPPSPTGVSDTVVASSRIRAATPSQAAPSSLPLPAPSTVPPEMAGLDHGDPSAVAAAVVRLWLTADTRVDGSPHDAMLRACPLLTVAYCDALRRFPPLSGPGAEWLALSADSAVLTVGAGDVRPAVESTPPDTQGRAVRLFEVTEHVSALGGPRPDRRLVVGVTLAREGAVGWRVTQVSPR